MLTYLLYAVSWLALGLGLLAPWLVHLLTTPHFYSAARVVGLLAFAAVAYSGYVVVLIGIGRARRTQSNWVITGAAALLNLVLNVILIPPYGMIGAAISTVAAYTAMFLAMAWRAQGIFHVPYQWRRIAMLTGAAAGLYALGKAVHAPLAVAAALTASYPLVLLVLRFYLPEERARMTRVLHAPSR